MYLTFAMIPNMIADVDQNRIIYLRATNIWYCLLFIKYCLYYIVTITEVQVLLFL